MTLIEVLRRATGYLETHGSDSARLDAELLLAHALGVRRMDLYLQFERPLAEPELVPYRELTARRARGEPVAYILGRREFMNLEFEVTPAVLVPNPDTETLVVRAVELLRALGRPARVADVGTGSGCIAVAVAHYVPGARVVAGDVSEAAVEVAARNAERHGVGDRVRLVAGSLLEPLGDGFDLVLANLPYLPEAADLPAPVRAQPALALHGGGERGSDLLVRLLEAAPASLRPGATVLAELDPANLPDVMPVAERLYAGARLHRDLGGHERVIEAWTAS